MAAVLIRPEADAELACAFGWYESRQPGRGKRFIAEVDRILDLLATFPLAYPECRGARRANVRGYPHCLLYEVEGNEVVVIAVMHSHRDPDDLEKRSKR